MGVIKPKAFVVVRTGYQAGDELVKTLQLHVKQKLSPYKYPRTIEFSDDLPKDKYRENSALQTSGDFENPLYLYIIANHR